MNTTNFQNWVDQKEKKALEEQIDPSFSRVNVNSHNNLSNQEDFPSVDEVAVAAVAVSANEQAHQLQHQHQQHQQQVLNHHHNLTQQQQNQLNQNQSINNPLVAQQLANSSPNSDDDKDEILTRNGKPLTNTKRAAQNRNAQRAFRQRKEQYIKELELQVSEVKALKETIESLRQENMQLRDYTLALQSRLIENPDNGVPTPPAVFTTRPQSDINLNHNLFKKKK